MSALTSTSQIPNFNANNSLVGKGEELDKEAFLLLLVTQFQYQDPLEPSSDTEFVAQLAQFTSLEQMMNLNTSMENLVTEQQKQMTLSAASLIGRDVSARGWNVSVQDGEVSQILYAHDVDIQSGVGNIFASDGTLIASIPIYQTTAGVHEFVWDGKTTTGVTAPDGVYTLAIAAEDANGESVLTDAQISGRVDAVSNYNGSQLLRLNDGRVVDLSEVSEILDVTASADSEDEDDTSFPQDTSGDDILTDTSAPDILTGGEGKDTFKLSPANFGAGAEDHITDFNITDDTLDLAAYKESGYGLSVSANDDDFAVLKITHPDLESKYQTVVFDNLKLTDDQYSSLQGKLDALDSSAGLITIDPIPEETP